MPLSPDHIEPELVSLLKSKDEKAYDYLYDHYGAALYGIILKIISVEETAQDVLQEVFVKIWRSIDSYDQAKGRLFTWMLNIARNTAIDMLRSKSFQQDLKIRELDDNVSKRADNPTPFSYLDHIGLRKLLENLKEEHRAVIDLAYFKGLTQEEIAKELNIPLGTVKTRTRNALIQLKMMLQ